jgi:O-antigen/teichoic acid export membrane protein
MGDNWQGNIQNDISGPASPGDAPSVHALDRPAPVLLSIIEMLMGRIGSRALVFIAGVLLARHLSEGNFGIYAFALGASNFFLIPLESFSVFSAREVAVYRGIGERAVNRILGVRLCLNLLLTAALLGATAWLSRDPVQRLALVIIAGRLFFRGIFVDWAFQGIERMRPVAWALLAEGGGFLIFVVGAIYAFDLNSASVATLGPVVGALLAVLIFAGAYVPRFGIPKPTFERGYTRELVSGALPLIFASTVYALWVFGPLLALKRWGSAEIVGNFGVAQQLLLASWIGIAAIVQGATPRLASILGRGQADEGELNRLVGVLFRFIWLIILPGAAFLACTSDYIFAILYPEKHMAGIRVLSIIIWMAPIGATGAIYGAVFMGLRRVKELLIVNSSVGLVNAIALCILVPRYGIIGAAIPCILGEMFAVAFYRLRSRNITSLRSHVERVISWRGWASLVIALIIGVLVWRHPNPFMRVLPFMVLYALLILSGELSLGVIKRGWMAMRGRS